MEPLGETVGSVCTSETSPGAAYYASIDHDLLLDRLAEFIQDPRVLNLIRQYLKPV